MSLETPRFPFLLIQTLLIQCLVANLGYGGEDVRLANLSSRGWADQGEKSLVAGFVISGPAESRKALLIRAAGPSLRAFGVDNALSAPLLVLYDKERRVIASNAGWESSENHVLISSQAKRLGAFPFSTGQLDSALWVELPPGVYSAAITPAADSTGGVGLIELYDGDLNGPHRLSNLSTRAYVQSGAPLIAGFVLSGEGERQVLLRAAGPQLNGFGIKEYMTDPSLRLIGTGAITADYEDNWNERPTSSLSTAFAHKLGAFELEPHSRDAALLAALPAPALQNVVITDERGGKGVALVEVYDAGPCLSEPPNDLQVDRHGEGRLSVSWQMSPEAKGYELVADGVVYTQVTSPFVHSGLVPGSHHHYALRTISDAGLGRLSPPVGATVSEAVAPSLLWAGTNQWQLPQQSGPQRKAQLEAMKQAGLEVLRLWVANRGDESWQIQPQGWTYEYPVGVFHADELDKLDRLMSECAELGIKLIVTMGSHANAARPDGFYADEFGIRSLYEGAGLLAYKNRITYLLNHRNPHLNHRRWKDLHEVILAWEICNESGLPLANLPGISTQERYRLHRNFLTVLADHLKREDPITWVATGTAGYARYYGGASSDDIPTLGDIPSVDIYTLHYYGGGLSNWLGDVLPVVRSWNKRLIVEEFGNERKEGMTKTLSNYREAITASREAGVPWMFWEMDLRKDNGTWGVMSDDEVWKELIAPEAALIGRTPSQDDWRP